MTHSVCLFSVRSSVMYHVLFCLSVHLSVGNTLNCWAFLTCSNVEHKMCSSNRIRAAIKACLCSEEMWIIIDNPHFITAQTCF